MRIALLAAAALALGGCAAEHRLAAALRVDPPGPGPGAPVDASERAVLEAVRSAAAAHGLACQPGRDVLLSCGAAALTGQVRPEVRLLRDGSGFRVTVEQWSRRGAPAPADACALARRLAAAVDQALGARVAHPVAGTPCADAG